MLIITIGFLARVAVAAWNGFAGPSFGAEADALEYHLRAVELLHRSDGDDFALGWVYAQALSWVYAVTGESLFIGSLLSCLAWLASAWLFAGIWQQLGLVRRGMLLAFLAYALLPTAVLHTAVTLREAYQLLFVNMAVLSGLRLLTRRRWADGLGLAAACLGMGLLHGALAAFAAMLIALMLLLRASARRKGKVILTRPARRIAMAALLLALLIPAGLALFPALQADLLESLLTSQRGYLLTDARAQYRTELALETPLSVLGFLPVALFQYLFEPLPWRGLALVDLGLVAENLLRAVLIALALRPLLRGYAMAAGPYFVGLAWLLLEALWAPGTVNWGTAARHHIPSQALLLAAAVAGWQAGRRSPRRTSSEPGNRPVAPSTTCPNS